MDRVEITPEFLAELRLRARKATPRPCDVDEYGHIDPGKLYLAGGCTDEDAEYIAAASPDIMLALIDHIEELDEENSAYATYYIAANNTLDMRNQLIECVCLALGIKLPSEMELSLGSGGRQIIDRIKELAKKMHGLEAEKAQLEKEADWLAERMSQVCHDCGDMCYRGDLPTCSLISHKGGCQKAAAYEWREAARKAVGGK